MARYSVHFVLKGKSTYKDLAPVFKDLLVEALAAADQMPEEEELAMLVQLNLDDLEKDQKPEGYIRRARVRMVFPMDRKEFYFQSYNAKVVDLNKLRENVCKVLDEAKIKYDLSEDDDISFDLSPRKKSS